MHIFISYAKVDSYNLATQLRDQLSEIHEVTAWMDETLIPGESWAAQIQSEIRRCDLVVVLLSPDVNREVDSEHGSSFVINEIEYALRHKKPIVPIMAQTTDIPIQIATLQYIDFTRDEVSGLKRLIQDIVRRIPKSSISKTDPNHIIDETAPINNDSQSESLVVIAPTPVVNQLSPEPLKTADERKYSSFEPVNIQSAQTNLDEQHTPLNKTPLIEQYYHLADETENLSTVVSENRPYDFPNLPEDTPPSAIQLWLSKPDNRRILAGVLAAILLLVFFWPLLNSSNGRPSLDTTVSSPTLTFSLTAESPIPPLTSAAITNEPSSFQLALTPVTHNVDWTPQYQTFNSVEMVLIPVGCFKMGSNDGEDDEKPVTKQCVQKPFWIDKTEVTNKQYGSEGYFKGDTHPRDSVTWFEARDFCAKRGDNVRLPTELEWEFAARGSDNLIYPWGNEFVTDNVVYSGNAGSSSAEVGSKPAGRSWVGAMDMSGNLWEWVSSIYESYPYLSNDGRENSDDANSPRVLLGGTWNSDDTDVRASNRSRYIPTSVSYSSGFRCARLY